MRDLKSTHKHNQAVLFFSMVSHFNTLLGDHLCKKHKNSVCFCWKTQYPSSHSLVGHLLLRFLNPTPCACNSICMSRQTLASCFKCGIAVKQFPVQSWAPKAWAKKWKLAFDKFGATNHCCMQLKSHITETTTCYMDATSYVKQLSHSTVLATTAKETELNLTLKGCWYLWAQQLETHTLLREIGL